MPISFINRNNSGNISLINRSNSGRISMLSAGSSIVTNGLVLNLDAGNPASYPGSGTTWTDLSGNGNNGTLTNGPTFDSANGGSIVFDGVNDLVNCGNNSSIQIVGDISILAWIKVTDFSNYNGIVGKTTSHLPNPYDYYLFQSTGQPSILRGDGVAYGGHTSNVSPSLGIWQYITVTMLGTQINHYLNGNFTSGGTTGVPISNGSNNLIIGNRSDNFTNFKGSIAITQIYNRALSATEVLQNYNAQKSRFGL
jgi:hypothetical protein